MTVAASASEALRAATQRLSEAGVPDAARDAKRLLAHVTGRSLPPETLTVAEAEAFDAAISRRARREPVSHITGTRAFWRHDFAVTPDVLDPRPETETLVEAALRHPWSNILDLGTGSGAILLSLLSERPGATGTGTDLSAAALAVARANAGRIGVASRARFLESDWWQAVEGRFDLIVSNPPYITEDEMGALAPELAFEPRLALTPGGDGLEAYRRITAGLTEHLVPGGWCLVEIGHLQGQAVTGLFAAAGLEEVTVHTDLDGRDRVISGRTPPMDPHDP